MFSYTIVYSIVFSFLAGLLIGGTVVYFIIRKRQNKNNDHKNKKSTENDYCATGGSDNAENRISLKGIDSSKELQMYEKISNKNDASLTYEQLKTETF